MSHHYQHIQHGVLRYLQQKRREAVQAYPTLDNPPPPDLAGAATTSELEGKFSPRNVLTAVLFHADKDRRSPIVSVGVDKYVIRDDHAKLLPICREYQARLGGLEAQARSLAPEAYIDNGEIRMPVAYFLRFFTEAPQPEELKEESQGSSPPPEELEKQFPETEQEAPSTEPDAPVAQ